MFSVVQFLSIGANLSFVQKIEGKNHIVYFSKKTGIKSVIPIFPQVSEILKKYDGLPRRYSGQKYNNAIKKVCELAGITNDIQLTKLEGDRRVPYILKKYDAITSHTSRRSFVTNLSRLGLTDKQISLMTGHSKVSTVQDYDKTKAETNALDVGEILKGRI